MKILTSLAFIYLSGISAISAQTNKERFDKDFDNAEKVFSKVYLGG